MTARNPHYLYCEHSERAGAGGKGVGHVLLKFAALHKTTMYEDSCMPCCHQNWRGS